MGFLGRTSAALAFVALSGMPAGGWRRPMDPRGPRRWDERREERRRHIVKGRRAFIMLWMVDIGDVHGEQNTMAVLITAYVNTFYTYKD